MGQVKRRRPWKEESKQSNIGERLQNQLLVCGMIILLTITLGNRISIEDKQVIHKRITHSINKQIWLDKLQQVKIALDECLK